jgi:hypothetical protein
VLQRRDCGTLRVGTAMLAILIVALMSVSIAKPRPKMRKLSGHVLGYVPNLLKWNGDGGELLSFVFVPDAAKKADPPAVPFAVEYRWFSDEPELPNSFFDFSKHFEIRASRNPDCDTTVQELFYIKVNYVGRPEKPPGREYYFRLAANAPKMDFADELKLPCYEMRPGNYSRLK